jgi:hypothetical protein
LIDGPDCSPKPEVSAGLDVVALDGTSASSKLLHLIVLPAIINHLPPQGESVPSKSILATCVGGAWICAAGSS